MKNLLISVALLGAVAAANANTIVNHSNKASPATVFAQSYQAAVAKQMPVDFFQAQNCEEAESKYVKTPGAIMAFNADVNIAAKSKGLKCDVNPSVKPENLVYVGSSYFKICKAKDQAIKLTDKRVTFGMASVVLSKGIINDYNSNGLNLIGVPYGGSKGVLAAVINKDINYGFIGASIAQPAIDAGQIVCELSTDPRDANFVGKTLKLKITDFRLASMIYTSEKDPKKVEAMRKAAATDKEFVEFLNKNGISAKTSNFTQADLDNFKKWVDFNYETYWK